MVRVSEKDGATIIVVENATTSEKRLIESARSLEASTEAPKKTNSVPWGKFKCNQKRKAENKPAKNVISDLPVDENGYVDLSGFETIWDERVPF